MSDNFAITEMSDNLNIIKYDSDHSQNLLIIICYDIYDLCHMCVLKKNTTCIVYTLYVLSMTVTHF